MRQQSHRVSFQIKSDPYLESVNHTILQPNFNSSPFDTFSCPFLKAGAHSVWHVRCQKNHALCADVSFKLGGEIGATRLKAVAVGHFGDSPWECQQRNYCSSFGYKYWFQARTYQTKIRGFFPVSMELHSAVWTRISHREPTATINSRICTTSGPDAYRSLTARPAIIS
jgi:hypothetical protein